LYETKQKKELSDGGQEIGGAGKYEMGDEETRHEIAQGSVKYGQHGENYAYEMPAAQAPVELPSSTVDAHAQR
jgi:hypothetical protein